MKEENKSEHIESVLWSHREEIAEALWKPKLQPIEVWVSGSLDTDEITIETVPSSTQPDPENWNDGEWLIRYEPVSMGLTKDEAEEMDGVPNALYEIVLNDLKDSVRSARVF